MVKVHCNVCANEFNVKPSHKKLGWGKFCSVMCRNKSQKNGRFFNCSTCEALLYREASKIKKSKSGLFFCSKSCQTQWRNSLFIENEHPNWTNGISAYRNILTRSGKEKKCANCNIDDERLLAVHHIDHDRTNNKLSNLMWLCMNCHFLIHTNK